MNPKSAARTPDPRPPLDVAGVARRLNVTERWIYDHGHDLPRFKVGKFLRFDPAEIDLWVLWRRRAPDEV